MNSDMKFDSRERKKMFLSAGIASCITSSIYNPLDCLKVRWQVLPRMDPLSSQGILRYSVHVFQTEGIIQGLWRPGIFANALGSGLSSALRFGYYESVRDTLSSIRKPNESISVSSPLGEEKHILHMLLSGLSCGAVAYFVATPFHFLKTAIQAEKVIVGAENQNLNCMISGARKIVKEKGILALYSGCIPLAARGALFTSGQMVGYDSFKSFGKQNGIADGPILQIFSSVISAFGAAFVSAPADVVMSKYMASKGESTTPLYHYIQQTYVESGVLGFWRGVHLNCLRLAPVMITYNSLYEQLRYRFGLGYFT